MVLNGINFRELKKLVGAYGGQMINGTLAKV